MKILFFGTPAFALTSLKEIVRLSVSGDLPFSLEIAGVVTQPDRPAGRGKALQTCAVAAYAREQGIPVYQPKTLKDSALWEAWQALACDLFVVVAYGRLLPVEVLAIPRWGTINVHASLLPKYRGAAPIERALMAGERETGVTIMEVTPPLDAGPILLKRALPISADDTAESLRLRLATAGATLLGDALVLYREGRPLSLFKDQDESRVTYAPPLKKEEGILDWNQTANDLDKRIRGLSIWPGTWTSIRGKKVKVLKARCSELKKESAHAGEIVHVSPQGIEVACCGDGVLSLEMLQLEGKRPLPARDFLNGFKLSVGERFT